MRSKHDGQYEPSPTFMSHSAQMNSPQRVAARDRGIARVIRARGRDAVGRLRDDLHRLVAPLARLERRGLELRAAVRAVDRARAERRPPSSGALHDGHSGPV